jgi:CheY-like chemotaxis protein
MYQASTSENVDSIDSVQSIVEEDVYTKKKVLVVDDDANIRRFVIAALNDFNCVFFEAADGLSAIKLSRNLKPDLIILDIQMEPLSGLDVLSIINRDESISSTPILVLTVKSLDRKFVEKAIELGAKTVLQKPIDTLQLENTVKSLFN